MEDHRGIAGAGARLALALLLLTGISGCGTGDEDPAGSAPTRSEFVAQANEICERNNEFLQQATVDAFGPDQQPDDQAGIRFTHRVWVPNLRQQSRDLRALDPPPGDRRRIVRMLDELDRATDRVEADPSLASQGPFDEVTRELTAYGIGPCGSP